MRRAGKLAPGNGCLSGYIRPQVNGANSRVISFIAHQTGRRVMGEGNMAFDYGKLSPEDEHIFNRWLKANAIGGAIFAIGLIAMALAGSRSVGPRDAEVASSTNASGVAVSEQRRRRPGVVTTQNPKIRQNRSD